MVTTLFIDFSDAQGQLTRLGVNYIAKVINYLQLHWKLFN